MTLCYRGADYEINQSIQPQTMSVTLVTLTYRGNRYQLNSQGSRVHRSMDAQSFQNNSQETAIVRPQLVYRGVTYTSY